MKIAPSEYETFKFKDGDILTLENCEPLITPDGNSNLLVADGRPIRIPHTVTLKRVRKFRMPEHLAVLTGAGTASMEPIGIAHVNSYEKHLGLTDGMSVLEIGCGIGRDVLELLKRDMKLKSYDGIDVTRDSVLWCKKNISRSNPNFRFHHFNAKHELYNPLGTRTSLDFELPVRDQSIDCIFAGSVFTHLFEDEVTHYMKEFCRVLKPKGLAYATFFLYSDETIRSARATKLSHNSLTFEHQHGDGCFVSDPNYHTGSVAYTDEAMQRMINAAGLRLNKPYLKGWWSGLHKEADDGQEVAILTPR